MSEFVTKDAPKRVLVMDYVEETARKKFGNKYDYSMIISDQLNAEDIAAKSKPRFTVILGSEESEIHNKGRDIKNRIEVAGVITKEIPSAALAHCFDTLSDIETMKQSLLGTDAGHKENMIYGHVRMNDETPNFTAGHQIDVSSTGLPILRAYFLIVLEIFNEGR